MTWQQIVEIVIGALVALSNFAVGLTEYPKIETWGSYLLKAANLLSILTHKDSPGTLKLPLTQSKDPNATVSSRGPGLTEIAFVLLAGCAIAATWPGCAAFKQAVNVVGSGACAVEPLISQADDLTPMVLPAMQGAGAQQKLSALEVIHGVDAVLCAVYDAVKSASNILGQMSPGTLDAVQNGKEYLRRHGVATDGPTASYWEKPMHFGILNQSPQVSDDQLRVITAALNLLGERYAQRWQEPPLRVEWLRGYSRAPDGIVPLAIFEQPGPHEAGVLGLHGQQGGNAWGKVFRPFFPTVLYDETGRGESMLEALGHEMLEIAGNPGANLMAAVTVEDGDGRLELVAREIVDPVEGCGRPAQLGGTAVSLPNFVLPAWYVADAAPPYDDFEILTKPGQILPPEGYASGLSARGEPVILAARRMQPWRFAHKRLAARGQRLGYPL